MDEMCIRDQIERDEEKMHGFVLMGTNVKDTNCDNLVCALVFIAVGINRLWKML